MQQSGGLLLTPVQTLVATLINESRWRANKRTTAGRPYKFNMVGIVQLAEHRIVVPGVVGSSPITHPRKRRGDRMVSSFFFFRVVMGLEK